MSSYHCPEYEYLTIEEKLLVGREMKEEWFKQFDNIHIVPTFIFKVAEERVIERLKRKETNDRRNRKQSTS